MESQWPESSLMSGDFKDVFHFARMFEVHCAKVYDHAAKYPDGAASAAYVMDLVSQAYRTVHSLHMQQLAISLLDQDTAIASLKAKAFKHCETQVKPSSECVEAVVSSEETVEDQIEDTVKRDLAKFFNGEIEDDENDSDWGESSDEETEDEYFEYNEETEGEDEDLECMPRMQRVRTIQEVPEDDSPETSQSPPIHLTTPQKDNIGQDNAAFTPPIMSADEQAAHDRITAALERISAKFEEAETVPLTRVQARAVFPLQRTPPPTDDSQSEATTIRPESSRDALSPLQTANEGGSTASETMNVAATTPIMERKASHDDSDMPAVQGSLTRRASVAVLPRRIKTVCHRYVRRAMLPIRGKAH